MKSKLLKTLGLFTVLAIGLALSPLPSPTMYNTEEVTRVVQSVNVDGGVHDIVIDTGDDTYYYINRGVERGLVLEELQHRLEQREVSIRYIRHFTPLDPYNSSRHIASIHIDGEEIYSEIKG